MSLFFMAVVLVLMIGVLEIPDADNAVGAFVFVILEFIILFGVFGLGSTFIESMGIQMYTVLCTTTSIYVILGTIINCAIADSVGGAAFVLINLALLFVYALVSVPLFVTGANSLAEKMPVDPNNPHNMPNPYSLGRVNNLPAQNAQPDYAPVDRNLPNPNSMGSVNGMRPAQPQYAPPPQQFAQPQYGQPQQFAQPQQAMQPQYAQTQYAQPQYAQPQNFQPTQPPVQNEPVQQPLGGQGQNNQ